jgi:hypothetical protein
VHAHPGPLESEELEQARLDAVQGREHVESRERDVEVGVRRRVSGKRWLPGGQRPSRGKARTAGP